MNEVSIDRYFQEQRWDDNFIQFLTYDIASNVSTTNVIFTLDTIRDPIILEFYNSTMEIKTLVIPKFKELKKLKATKKKKKQVFELNNKYFDLVDNQIKILIRMMERNDSMYWLLYPLYHLSKQLYNFSRRHNVTNTNITNSNTKSNTATNSNDFMERTSRSIHKCFTMCLNDRNPNKKQNKGQGIYYFINLEFKIYHNLKNRDMIKNLVKVIENRINNKSITDINNIHVINKNKNVMNNNKLLNTKSQIVQFNYYMGKYYGCQENDYYKSCEYLNRSLMSCNIKYKLQIERILVLLIPFTLLTRRLYFNNNNNELQINLPEFYTSINNSIKHGNIKEFNKIINVPENEIFTLKNGLYICFQLLINLVNLNYIKIQVKKLNGSTGKMNSIISIKDNLKEINECSIATLINKGYIKGYLSHGHNCIVLSKKDPFPIITRPF